jgi:hypothetical protein
MMDGHWLHEWDDETSSSDPKGRWVGGSEYYARTYRIWVPNRIKPTQKKRLLAYIESQAGIPDKWVG